MKKFSASILLLLVGIAIGWISHGLSKPESQQSSALSLDQTDLLPRPQKTIQQKDVQDMRAPIVLDQRLLLNPQLDKLIAIFKLDMTVDEKEEVNRQLVQYARNLIKNANNKSNIEKQLLRLLNVDSIQADIVPLLVAHYEKTRQNQKAIKQLFKLRNLVTFDGDYLKINRQIEALTEKHIEALTHANQKEKLTSFYEEMLLIEPDNYNLQMKFAKFEYDNKHYENALNLLSILIYHTELNDEALQLLQKTQTKIDRLSAGNMSISVVKHGAQFVVNAIINNLEPVKLMIDTGASMTILSPAIINSLGLMDSDSHKTMRFSTANGEVNARVMTIQKFEIQQYAVNDLDVAVLSSFPMGSIDGLLGMDFLSQFSFFIDQDNLTLQLSDLEQ